MPCPYNIILGRDTALPWTLYPDGVTGIEITPPGEYSGRARRPFHSLRGECFVLAIERYFHIYHVVIPPYVEVLLIFNPNHWLSSAANHSISDSLSPGFAPS